MITCRYVGSDCSSLGEREFDTIGQRAVLSEQGFREAIIGRAAFIPEQDFYRCNFTPEELTDYGPSGLRVDPPQSFLSKLAIAQEIFRGLVREMESEAIATLAEVSDNVREPEPVIGL